MARHSCLHIWRGERHPPARGDDRRSILSPDRRAWRMQAKSCGVPIPVLFPQADRIVRGVTQLRDGRSRIAHRREAPSASGPERLNEPARELPEIGKHRPARRAGPPQKRRTTHGNQLAFATPLQELDPTRRRRPLSAAQIVRPVRQTKAAH